MLGTKDDGGEEELLFYSIFCLYNKEHEIVASWQKGFNALVFLWIIFTSHSLIEAGNKIIEANT